MAAAKRPGRAKSGSDEVSDFLHALTHPRKPELVALRSIILAASPTISEGIKWNAPSFRVNEWFATMHLRDKEAMLILHLGAKVRDVGTLGIDDPERLLQWLGKDRAAVRFADMDAINTHRAAFTAVLRQWIELLD
jgi:hypothetical protein